MLSKLDMILLMMWTRVVAGIQNVVDDERGDTNFISILIILGIVIVVAGVFMGFKDQIVTMVQDKVNAFTIH